MIRNNVLNQVGAFDPRFFMYYEETELCHRIRKRKYKIMSIPSAKIVHLDGGGYRDMSCQRRQVMNTSREIYYNIVYNEFYVSIVKTIWKIFNK